MKKSRRIASFLMLSTSKNEEVSQNCFVFDVLTLKMRKSRRIASFLMLSTLKNEEVFCRIAKFSSLQIDR